MHKRIVYEIPYQDWTKMKAVIDNNGSISLDIFRERLKKKGFDIKRSITMEKQVDSILFSQEIYNG